MKNTVGTPYNMNVGVQKIPDRAIWKPMVVKRNTVKPVYNDHPVGQANMVAQDRWSQMAGRHGSQTGTQNRLCCRHS